MAIMTWLYDHAPKPVQDWLDSRAFQQMADIMYDEYLTRKEAGTTTVLDRWNFEPHEPSAELNAVMALSGDRSNAGTLPEAANDGIHLLKMPTEEAVKAAILEPINRQAQPMAEDEVPERFKSAVEDRLSGDVAKAQANLHYAKDQQQRAADFWQRTLGVGRQQQQSGKQMRAAEREVSKEPRLKM